jgi:hypothetical protein
VLVTLSREFKTLNLLSPALSTDISTAAILMPEKQNIRFWAGVTWHDDVYTNFNKNRQLI